MSKNKLAIKINEKLGVPVFNENVIGKLKLIEYSRKEIKELCLDDLIEDGYWSKRLTTLVHEIEMGE